MTSVATIQPEPMPIVACTVSRAVQNFDHLIDEMENELGEAWGDLGFEDALVFLGQPEAANLQFLAIALDAEDEADLRLASNVISRAKESNIRVILVAKQLSPIGLHQLMRLGADDFVPYPLPDGSLAEVIRRIRAPAPQAPAINLLPETPPVAPKAPNNRHGILLPVHAMSGGTGASTFAVNLAWELANIDKNNPPRVCLMDLDFQYGSVATYLDLPRKETIFELLTDPQAIEPETIARAMQNFNDRLDVFTAPPEMLPLDIISSEDLGQLLDIALTQYDYVIVDMPKTVVVWTEAVLARAGAYFTMLELDLRSAQNMLRFARALKAEGLPFEKLRYVLNRAPRFTDLSGKSRAKRMAESLDISFEVLLPDGGVQITQANDHGLPIAESSSKNPLRKELQKLAKSLFELHRSAKASKTTA